MMYLLLIVILQDVKYLPVMSLLLHCITYYHVFTTLCIFEYVKNR